MKIDFYKIDNQSIEDYEKESFKSYRTIDTNLKLVFFGIGFVLCCLWINLLIGDLSRFNEIKVNFCNDITFFIETLEWKCSY